MAYIPKISDAAVKKATGKTWKQWFVLLDKAGAQRMKHIDIARFIHKNYLGGDKNKNISPDVAKSGGWWSQIATVEYERSRGLRAVNQNASGFNVSVHGTFAMPVSKLFSAWRRRAPSEGLLESTVRKNKSIRYKAAMGAPRYLVMFTAKKKNVSRIGFEAMRLSKSSDVEKQRAKWKKIIAMMKKDLEKFK